MKTLGTHNYYVYILTNKAKTALYIGVTNDLVHRIRFHRENANLNLKAFTSKYRCFYLVYYEQFSDIEIAIAREKQLKGWLRIKKEKLIEGFNPNWRFLNNDIK